MDDYLTAKEPGAPVARWPSQIWTDCLPSKLSVYSDRQADCFYNQPLWRASLAEDLISHRVCSASGTSVWQLLGANPTFIAGDGLRWLTHELRTSGLLRVRAMVALWELCWGVANQQTDRVRQIQNYGGRGFDTLLIDGYYDALVRVLASFELDVTDVPLGCFPTIELAPAPRSTETKYVFPKVEKVITSYTTAQLEWRAWREAHKELLTQFVSIRDVSPVAVEVVNWMYRISKSDVDRVQMPPTGGVARAHLEAWKSGTKHSIGHSPSVKLLLTMAMENWMRSLPFERSPWADRPKRRGAQGMTTSQATPSTPSAMPSARAWAEDLGLDGRYAAGGATDRFLDHAASGFLVTNAAEAVALENCRVSPCSDGPEVVAELRFSDLPGTCLSDCKAVIQTICCYPDGHEDVEAVFADLLEVEDVAPIDTKPGAKERVRIRLAPAQPAEFFERLHALGSLVVRGKVQALNSGPLKGERVLGVVVWRMKI